MSKLDENIARLAPHLERYRQGGILNMINGKDDAGKATFRKISPKKNIEPASRFSTKLCLPRQP
mgnify:CR=1 FL=1